MSTGKRIVPPFSIVGNGGTAFGNSGVSGTMTSTNVITSKIVDCRNQG